MANFFKKVLDPLDIFGKKKGAPSYEAQPYAGPTPPGIDANGKEYLRPTQDLTQGVIGQRAQGIGVGYDPRRTELLTNLARSQNQMSLEDSLHSAQGQLASSGLSGNPRAYEALAGRAQRDASRSLDNNISQIAISDLERGNQERDANTARLQRLNETNFGQENTKANFGLDQYQAEQGNKKTEAGMQQQNYQYDQNRRDQQLAELGQFGFDAASLAMGNPAPIVMNAASSGQGQGIAPNLSAPSYYNTPLNRTGAYRNLVR